MCCELVGPYCMHVMCSLAVMITPVAPQGCQGLCKEGSRKTLARMFPVPLYRKSPSGDGAQQEWSHSGTQMDAHGTQEDPKWASDQGLEAAVCGQSGKEASRLPPRVYTKHASLQFCSRSNRFFAHRLWNSSFANMPKTERRQARAHKTA